MQHQLATALIAATLALAAVAQDKDKDGDRDGLSDFQEAHKYLTDPSKADSDGDGIPDGDWAERREFAYTVHAVINVMAPFDVASMNDDFQDVRVLERRPDLLEFEVVLYPLNTVGDAIETDAHWRKTTARMKEDVAPGVTTNWDAAMQRELVAALKKDGIDAAALDDRALVQQASKWILRRAQSEDSFTTFAVEFVEGGKPRINERQRHDVDQQLERTGRTLAQQWDRELFGKGMFENKLRGSCTSSAIYVATCFKALGIPTRSIICVPIVDASDKREVEWVRSRITHNRVRDFVLRNVEGKQDYWTSHTFNEVFVGGRWRRLNYDKLGQNILDRDYLGLMVHVNTYRDQADTELVGWGNRAAHPLHDALFGGNNPYSCASLSDQFGAHAKVDNPTLDDGEFKALTISRLYWYDDPRKEPMVSMKLDAAESAGHLLMHIDESRADDDSSQYKRFYETVAKEFVLRAAGKPDVLAHATRGYWADPSRGVQEFYLRIEPDEFEHMVRGVAYELAALAQNVDASWVVKPGVSITRAKH